MLLRMHIFSVVCIEFQQRKLCLQILVKTKGFSVCMYFSISDFSFLVCVIQQKVTELSSQCWFFSDLLFYSNDSQCSEQKWLLATTVSAVFPVMLGVDFVYALCCFTLTGMFDTSASVAEYPVSSSTADKGERKRSDPPRATAPTGVVGIAVRSTNDLSSADSVTTEDDSEDVSYFMWRLSVRLSVHFGDSVVALNITLWTLTKWNETNFIQLAWDVR